MKKRVFLTILMSCIMVISFGNTTSLISTAAPNQEYYSKTEDNSEIYTGENLTETEENQNGRSLSEVENTQNNTAEANITEAQSGTTEKEGTNIQKTEEQNLNQSTTIEKAENELTSEKLNQEATSEKNAEQQSENQKSKKVNQVSEKEETTKNSNKTSNSATTQYSFLKNPENISAENIKAAEKEISLIPQNILDSFSYYNWTVSITNENISKKYFGGSYGNVMGVTITYENKILIQNRKRSIEQSIIHEFGHYVDSYFNFPSLDDEFKQIYKEEVSAFKSGITNASCVRDEREFFAHTFYYSIKNPSKCTPRALEFVQRYVGKI